MQRAVVLIVSAALLLSLGAAAAAAEGDEKKVQWFDKIKFGGDLRLRFEHFDWEDKFDDDIRDRFRYRFRFGATATLTDKVKVGFQLRSGNPDNPHSDNQSFDTGFDKNTISIAEAFVAWQPREFIGITGGKFSPKKIWLVSDMQWDDDVIVEGVMENFRFGGAGPMDAFEATAYQFILEESSSSGDAYLVGLQLRPRFTLNEKNQLTVGATYDAYSRPDNVVGLTLGGDLDTEPEGVVTNLVDPATGELVSDFRVLTAFFEWKNKASKRWPVKLSYFYYRNLGAEDAVGAIVDDEGTILVGGLNSEDNDTGYFARVQVGDYKKPGQVAVRLSRYHSEPDAIFYAWVQSDTRRGSNVDGERLDIRIGMPLKQYINVTWYHTDWMEGDDTTMDRWQFDYIFKF
jgi:hypothetical protein